MPGGFSYWFRFGFGTPPEGVSAEQATDLLVQLLPKGAATWYGLKARVGDVYNTVALMGDMAKEFGHDLISVLRSETNPLTTANKLEDWEGALGIAGTPTARNGTTPQRRNAIVSKLRESGAFTIANIQAIIGPLLGYADTSQLDVIECSRSALTALHTHSSSPAVVVAPAGTNTQTYSVNDGGSVSAAGVQVVVNITNASLGSWTVKLTGPDGASKTWTLTGGASATDYYLYDKTSFTTSATVNGTWTVLITNGAGTSGTINTVSVFVEGVGAGLTTGGAMYDWGVYADPAKYSSPDFQATRNALQRIKPAFSVANLIQSIAPYPDTSSGLHSSIPDECIPV